MRLMTIGILVTSALPLPAQDSPLDWVSVREFGAVGDGEADYTAAFERALEAAREKGLTVYVPMGQYRLTRSLRVEKQLLLGQVAGGWNADAVPQPTLIADHVDGPCIEMGSFASIHGLAIVYPVDAPFPEENAPPAILLNGGQPSITSVRIQYAYDGITTAEGAAPGRARLADIFIVSPKHDGVQFTRSYDVAQFRNVEVWCNVGMSTGAGFRFGRSDDGAYSDLFAFNCQEGFVFETDESEGGGRFYGSMSNCSTDACSLGVIVRGNHMINWTTSDLINHHASLDIEGEGASLRFTGCLFQSNGAPAVDVRECGALLVSSSRFQRAFEAPHYFVDAAACGSLTVMGCQFSADSSGVRLGEGVERAVVAYNAFEGGAEGVVDEMKPEALRLLEPNVGP